MVKKSGKLFKDFLKFVELETTSGDLEPWAELLRLLRENQTEEQSLWLMSLYNTYDSFSSAWGVYKRWPEGPLQWGRSKNRDKARDHPCMQERRNLHGGRVLRRLADYEIATKLAGSQDKWLRKGFDADGFPEHNFNDMMRHVRTIWGVGRQAGFEWVEFLGKVNEFPVTAPDAVLWESSGPRHAIEMFYKLKNPTAVQLNECAEDLRDWLKENGFPLPWEDFETVICDFKVMTRGRYYPGRHLAALRGEIDEVDSADKKYLLDAFQSVIPYPWSDIRPNIDKNKMPIYKNKGIIIDKPME